MGDSSGFLFWRFIGDARLFGPEMSGHHNYLLVVLSFLVASVAGFTALEVVDRLLQPGSPWQRRFWIASGAVAMGTGVWAMHFIGMLAFTIPVPVGYRVSITAISLLPAIFASFMAIRFLDRTRIDLLRLNAGGLLMAVGIGGMHFTGMEAMQMEAEMGYDPFLWALSIVVAHVLSTMSLYVKFTLTARLPMSRSMIKLISAPIMGAAVCGMHYTAMASSKFYEGGHMPPPTQVIEPTYLALGIAAVTAIILGIAIVGSIVDRRMERLSGTLLESEERLRLIVDSADGGILGLDANHRISFANHGTAEMFGRKVEELVGCDFHEAMHGSRSGGPVCTWHNCFILEVISMERNRHSTKESIVRADGSRLPVRCAYGPLFGLGRFSGAVVTLVDMTVQREAEQQLILAKTAAEETSRAKAQFLANTSHEIRTPMNGVLGMTTLLLDTPLNSEQREYAETAMRSAESLLSLINDLLDFSKIEARKVELENLDFELRPCLDDIGSMFAHRAEEKGLELVIRVAPRVPTTIGGDPGRLRQVLVNLVGNAIKFTSKGEIVVSVDVESEAARRINLGFSVSDTGIGIPAKHFAGVFEAFNQADTSTTRRYGGTGLGLTISKSLVHLMGGDITLESREGKGTTFRFNAKFDRREDALRVPRCLPEDLRGKRVLVVDDNEVNRRVLVEQLKHFELAPHAVGNAAAALEQIDAQARKGEPFDLAILDYAMPDVDGEELGRRIRAGLSREELPLVMLTSLGRRGDAARMREAGLDAYLVKPVKQSYLLDAIMMVLGKRSLESPEPEPLVTVHAVDERRLQDRGKILVAEDNVMNQKVILAVLKKLGYTSEIVENGKDAVDAVQNRSYDIVLMDCQMPVMDGFEAAGKIRGLAAPCCDIPIIAMTANAMQGDREKCIAAGMTDYATKPVDREKLAALLEKYVGPRDASAGSSGPDSNEPDSKSLETSIFDVEALRERIDNDEELLLELVRDYLDHIPTWIGDIRREAENGSGDGLRRASHAMKGAALNMAMVRVAACAESLEVAGSSGRTADAPDLVLRLESETDAAREVLTRFVGTAAGKGVER